MEGGEQKALAVLSMAILAATTAAARKGRPKRQPLACKAYFIVVEQDREVTVNLAMIGLNRPQSEWYKKHGIEYGDLCLVNGDTSGNRVALDSASESYIASIVGEAPLYSIAWEQHRTFVPDSNGGHYAWSSNGILSLWDNSKKDFVPMMPIHNTNRTIFSSSSTSLLKDGLKELENRIETR